MPASQTAGIMQLERTMAGLEARLKPHLAERWSGAVFLAVWLIFWVVGEAFALWILIMGGWSLITDQPPAPGRAPLELGPSLLAGVFLLGWLTFWTFGGVMAWHEFFRLVWSSDRLLVRSDGLEVTRRVGPFTTQKFLPLDTLRGFFRVDSNTAVQAETTGGVVELTRNGTPTEQTQLISTLRTELRLPVPEQLPPVLPVTWCEVRTPEGEDVLVKDVGARRIATRVAWIIALPLTWATLAVLREAWTQPNLRVAAAMLTVAMGFVLWGTVRLTWAREEWRLESGRLVRQKRFGSQRREGLSGRVLQLKETTDSDGDHHFELSLRGDDGSTRKLWNQMHDSTEPRQLGHWLAARTGITFEDRATAQERARVAAEQSETRRIAGEYLKEWLRSIPGFGRRRESAKKENE